MDHFELMCLKVASMNCSITTQVGQVPPLLRPNLWMPQGESVTQSASVPPVAPAAPPRSRGQAATTGKPKKQ